jgi:hypothetical protein
MRAARLAAVAFLTLRRAALIFFGVLAAPPRAPSREAMVLIVGSGFFVFILTKIYRSGWANQQKI